MSLRAQRLDFFGSVVGISPLALGRGAAFRVPHPGPSTSHALSCCAKLAARPQLGEKQKTRHNSEQKRHAQRRRSILRPLETCKRGNQHTRRFAQGGVFVLNAVPFDGGLL